MIVAVDGRSLGSGRGGDETYATALLTALARAADPDDRFPLYVRPAAAVPAEATADRFPRRELGGRSEAVRYLWSLPRALRAEPRRPDVLHSVLYAPPRSPVPVALMVPDLSFRHQPEFYSPATRLRLNMLVPGQVRRAAVVMTVSEFCRDDIVAEYGVERERVCVVPNAVAVAPEEDSAARADRAAWLHAQGLEAPFFLYLGNLHPRKNVDRLVRAFLAARSSGSDLAEHRLVIAGAAWWGGERTRELVARAGDHVRFLGRVSDRDRDRLLRSAQALAYPSLFEGFGLPPIEAMAMGTPVLVANATALPETVGDAALLVDPLDEDAIAAGLVRLAADSGLRRELGERGRRRAALYSYERMGGRALGAFRRAAGAGSAAVGSSARA